MQNEEIKSILFVMLNTCFEEETLIICKKINFLIVEIEKMAKHVGIEVSHKELAKSICECFKLAAIKNYLRESM